MELQNVIPEMNHPLSKHWSQPERSKILIDKSHALMETDSLKELAEYSSSIPSGVYEGKMWKRRYENGFLLCWFGEEDNESKVLIQTRIIITI